jgi:nucleotidyltransferase/DNA polymerase involved in DNA repair
MLIKCIIYLKNTLVPALRRAKPDLVASIIKFNLQNLMRKLREIKQNCAILKRTVKQLETVNLFTMLPFCEFVKLFFI